MNIGGKIKRLRIANQLTLEELANRSELTKGFLSQVERNLTSPSIATLEDILEALGTTLHDFFNETQEEQIVFKKTIILLICKMTLQFLILCLMHKKCDGTHFN